MENCPLAILSEYAHVKDEATQHEEETHSRLAAKIKLLPYQMARHNQGDGETSKNLDTFKFLL